MDNKVATALKLAQSTYPELRSGQIISNALFSFNERRKRVASYENFQIDLFYLTDDELAAAIIQYIGQLHIKKD